MTNKKGREKKLDMFCLSKHVCLLVSLFVCLLVFEMMSYSGPFGAIPPMKGAALSDVKKTRCTVMLVSFSWRATHFFGEQLFNRYKIMSSVFWYIDFSLHIDFHVNLELILQKRKGLARIDARTSKRERILLGS